MTLLILASLTLLAAAALLAMTFRNLARFHEPAADSPLADEIRVSVCVPARDEEDNLAECIHSILSSDHANLQVLVYDDQSTDRTPQVLAELCKRDSRCRAVPSFPLPPGWNGKQHACAQMGFTANGDYLLFTDADVRFAPDAVRRATAFAEQHGLALVSAFPRQRIGSLGELLLTPMMFFVLMAYLPMGRMRQTLDPKSSAGCGQFLLVRRDVYRASGGHTAIRNSMHDGIKLPRLLREHGSRTDIIDGTNLASVRMYRGLAEAWQGFAKNAFEGLGSVAVLVFFTVTHLLAYLLPWVLLPIAIAQHRFGIAALVGLALFLPMLQRWVLAKRFRHSRWLALLHPASIILMTVLQWYSYMLHRRGKRWWRGRRADHDAVEQVVAVDETGIDLGPREKLAVHRGEGEWHRAFSLVVFDATGRVLLQKRAGVKYHFAGRWANACCGHPRPGETPAEAGRRRVREELGLDLTVREVAHFRYEARDDASGLIERELDHVLVSTTDAKPTPNPLEVDAVRWVTPQTVSAELELTPEIFAPWFGPVWDTLRACEAALAEPPQADSRAHAET